MAAAPPIRIQVGASKDASIDRVFGSIEARARRSGKIVASSLNSAFKSVEVRGTQAAKKIESDMARAMRPRTGGGDPFRMVPQQATRAYSRVRQESRRAAMDAEKEWTKASRKAAASHEREWQRAMERGRRITQREAAAQSRAQRREFDRFATRTSHRATRFFWPNMPVTSMARRAAGDVLRGIGVETNLSSLVGRITRAEEIATAVTTQAYRPGAQGFAGQRFSTGKLQEEARALGHEFAFSTEQILEGQKAFVDLEGDLEAARNISQDMARLSKSQNVDFTETMHTAAKANQMFAAMPEYAGDTEKRFAAVNELMHRLVYEGKVGSITMEYMAKNFAKLSGITGLFAGSPMKAAIQLTTLAQMAEAGPAKNPAQATTMIQAFAGQLLKRSRDIESVTGVKISGPKGISDPFSVVEAMLIATSGGKDIKKRGWKQAKHMTQAEVLMEALGGRKEAFLGGFMKSLETWTRATGGASDAASIERGRRALREKFGMYGGAVTKGQEEKDLAERMKSAASKAQQFNQQLEKVVASAATKVMPALEKLAPTALSLADALAKLAAWAAANPWSAVMTMIGLSVGRALGESYFRKVLERVILGAGAGGAGRAGAAGIAGSWGGRQQARGAAVTPIGWNTPVGTAAKAGFSKVRAGVNALGMIPATAMAIGGVALAVSEAEKLRKIAGSKTSVYEGLPGFDKRGNFDVTKAVWDTTIAMPGTLMRGAKTGYNILSDVWGSDERLNAQAQQQYRERLQKEWQQGAAKAPLSEALAGIGEGGGRFSMVGLSGKAVNPMYEAPKAISVGQATAQAAMKTADATAQIATKINSGIRVINLDEIKIPGGGEGGPGTNPGLEEG